MWQFFDDELGRHFDAIREQVTRSHLTPTREWPLIFVAEHDVLLVVREWPNGTITAYATSEFSERIRGKLE